MSSTVEQIKERLGIVDVVSSYVKLEKAGKNLKARCPFHTEKTASFFVSPDRETYHCFGCGKGGDIFSFVEDIEGLDFSGALKVLAERAGVVIARFDNKDQEEKKRLYSILEEATLFFESNIRGRKDVGEYLKTRGLTGKTAKLWRVGYVPLEWRSLYSFLKDNGYSDEDMVRAGLVVESKGKIYDRFRGRILFPIMDASGRPVAFSGRVFDEMQKNQGTGAKYINSSETILYNKSKILYGFDKAKMAIRKSDSCIVVEGQMDVVLSHQAGHYNTVAASGTALTEEHLRIIGRLTRNLVLAFDADEAGFRAMERTVGLALSSQFGVSIAHLPSGLDPADVIKAGSEQWGKHVDGAKHVIEFYLDALSSQYPDVRTMRLQIEKRAIPLIARLQSHIEQAHFVKLVSNRIGIAEESIWRAVRSSSARAGTRAHSGVLPRGEGEDTFNSKNPDEVRLQSIQKRLLGVLLWQEKGGVDITHAKKQYEHVRGEQFEDALKKIEEAQKSHLIFEAEIAHQNSKDIKIVLEELFQNLNNQMLKIKLADAMKTVHEAEKEGNELKAKEALAECQKLSKLITS